MSIILLIGIIAWCYGLSVLKRAELPAYYFIFGSVGLFFILFFLSRTYIMWLMIRAIIHGVSLVTTPLGLATAYPIAGVFSITHGVHTLLLSIDYECSGVLETISFWALLFFFPVYKVREKLQWAGVGILWIFGANFIRLLLIISIVHYFGTSWFFLAHSILGRLVFYILVVYFYYKVFTFGQLSEHRQEGVAR